MKLRKLLALVLTLSVCASLMAPMASAAYPYDGSHKNIDLSGTTATEVEMASDGTKYYDVSMSATLNLSNNIDIANAIAAYITGDNNAAMAARLAKLQNVRFECGLSAKGIAALAGNNLNYTLEGEGKDLYIQGNVEPKGDDLLIFHLTLNMNGPVKDWTGDTVTAVQEKIAADLAKTVTFTASRQHVALTSNFAVEAYVDVFVGQTQYANRIAWGNTTLLRSSSSGGSSSSGTSTPTPTPTEPVVIEAQNTNENGEETTPKTADEVAAQADMEDVIGEEVTLETQQQGDSKTNRLSLNNLSKKAGEKHLGVTDVAVYDPNNNMIANTSGNALPDYVNPTTGQSIPVQQEKTTDAQGNQVIENYIIDPETNEKTVLSRVTTGKDGTPVIEFYTDGKVVVEYEIFAHTPEETGIDALLITDNHIAYTNGDGYGNWRPNDKITRSEAATMLYRLLRNKDVDTSEVSFSDVEEGKWYTTAVKTLAALGIIKGDTAGSFRPNDGITRAEFTAICVRFATKEANGAGKEFADVSSTNWAHDEIGKAAAFGWVIGYPEGIFQPSRALSRAEAVTLLNRVLGRPGDSAAIAAGKGVTFSDVAKTFWGYNAIVESATAHNYTKDEVTNVETWAN